MKQYFWGTLLTVWSLTSFAQSTPNQEIFPKNVIFRTLDNSIITANDFPIEKPLMIIYFDPDCGHCKVTGKELTKYIADYPEMAVWLISAYPEESIKDYIYNSGLYPAKKLFVMRDYLQRMHDWFDFAYVPLIVLYGHNKKLVKDFDKLPEPMELRKILAAAEED